LRARARLRRLGESTRSVRTGINAPAVYLETRHGRVVLFFTGRHHAGEIIDRLLAHRRSIAKPTDHKLIKVTDTASKNFDHAQHDRPRRGGLQCPRVLEVPRDQGRVPHRVRRGAVMATSTPRPMRRVTTAAASIQQCATARPPAQRSAAHRGAVTAT